MFEAVRGPARRARMDDEARGQEEVEVSSHGVQSRSGDGHEDVFVEGATEDRRSLCEDLCGAQSVEARHQRLVKPGRDGALARDGSRIARGAAETGLDARTRD